jgi:hypothetical protein
LKTHQTLQYLSIARHALLATAFIFPLAEAAVPVPKCNLALAGTVPLSFTGTAFAPTIEGSINGSPTRVLINLSSYSTHIEASALERLGIPYRNTFTDVSGVGGQAPVYQARVKELKAGPARGKGEYTVMDTESADYGFSVGADFLLRMDLEISLADKYIKFFSPQNCEGVHIGYWDANAISIPFSSVAEDLRPRFKVKVNGHEVSAILSPSTARSVIDSRIAKKIGLTPDSSKMVDAGIARGLGASTLKYWRGTIDKLEIGNEAIANVQLGMLDTGPVEQVILGADFMRTHRILISMEQKRIYLSYLGGEIFPKDIDINEPWFLAELEAGNPDAQNRMGLAELAKPMAERDIARQVAWFEKSAAQGSRRGQIGLGHSKLFSGDFAGSAIAYQQAKSQRNSHTFSAWAYVASARAGKAVQALAELKATKFRESEDWDVNIVDFLTGKIDAKALRKSVPVDPGASQSACLAEYYIAQAYIIGGKPELARPVLETVVATCPKNVFQADVAKKDLSRLPAQ